MVAARRGAAQKVGAYLPKTSCIAPQTSPIEQRSCSAWLIAGQQVVAAARDLAQVVEALLDERLVAVGLERGQAVELFALGLRVDAQQVGNLDVVLLTYLLTPTTMSWPMR